MTVILAAALAGATFLLVLACLGDAHRAGLDRLHRAGHIPPWWLPHNVDDCTACTDVRVRAALARFEARR